MCCLCGRVNGVARKIWEEEEEEEELAPSFWKYLAYRAEGALGPNGFVEPSTITVGKLYLLPPLPGGARRRENALRRRGPDRRLRLVGPQGSEVKGHLHPKITKAHF